MLLRNTRTGFVYAYNKVLASDPEFEEFVEEACPPAPVPEEQRVVVIRKKRAKPNGNTVQPSNQ